MDGCRTISYKRNGNGMGWCLVGVESLNSVSRPGRRSPTCWRARQSQVLDCRSQPAKSLCPPWREILACSWVVVLTKMLMLMGFWVCSTKVNYIVFWVDARGALLYSYVSNGLDYQCILSIIMLSSKVLLRCFFVCSLLEMLYSVALILFWHPRATVLIPW